MNRCARVSNASRCARVPPGSDRTTVYTKNQNCKTSGAVTRPDGEIQGFLAVSREACRLWRVWVWLMARMIRMMRRMREFSENIILMKNAL